MPKKPVDYSKACVYKICCKNITIKDVYVGSTTNLHKRRSQHKCDCNKPDSKGHNIPVYQFIRSTGGWDCWEVVKIEDCPCDCDEDLRRCERYWMERLQATLNSINPFTGFATHQEYHKDYDQRHKDHIVAYQKVYRQEHKEEILANQKAHYQNHKEEILAYQKEYRQEHKVEIAARKQASYQKNKEEILAKQKAHYQKNKVEIAAKASEKVTCQHCQSIVGKSGLATHRKTKKCSRARGID